MSVWSHPELKRDPFVYKETVDSEHFRILILHNGQPHEPLECSLETLSCETGLSTEYGYEALSYVWGSTKVMEHIICEDQKLAITPSLATTLQHLRHDDVPRRLWIDQICIDQANLNERSIQVQNMGTVYRSAKRVVVWLGEDYDGGARAVKFAQELNEAVSAFEQSYPGSTLIHEDLGKPLKPTNYSLPPLGSQKWTECSLLLSRRWFTRLWIVQEVALNKDVIVQCGYSYVSWVVLEQLFRHSLRHRVLSLRLQKGLNPSQHLLYMTPFMKEASGNLWVENAVEMLSRQQTSDPRDYVYAALSLARISDSQGIMPNYHQSTANVYTDFTRRILEKIGRRSVINFARLNPNPDFTVPSWVETGLLMQELSRVDQCPKKISLHPDHASHLGGLRTEGRFSRSKVVKSIN